MGDSCPLKGTKLTSPTHILLCMAIEYAAQYHNKGYTKNYGN